MTKQDTAYLIYEEEATPAVKKVVKTLLASPQPLIILHLSRKSGVTHGHVLKMVNRWDEMGFVNKKKVGRSCYVTLIGKK